MIDNPDLMMQVAQQIEEDGGDPKIVLPLLDLISEAALAGARAKLDDDHEMAAVMFGRVSGIMECFIALGQPLPAEDPVAVLETAERALTNPEGFKDEVAAAVADLEPDEDQPTLFEDEDTEYEVGEGHWIDDYEPDHTPYLTEDYDFHNEEAAGEEG